MGSEDVRSKQENKRRVRQAMVVDNSNGEAETTRLGSIRDEQQGRQRGTASECRHHGGPSDKDSRRAYHDYSSDGCNVSSDGLSSEHMISSEHQMRVVTEQKQAPNVSGLLGVSRPSHHGEPSES